MPLDSDYRSIFDFTENGITYRLFDDQHRAVGPSSESGLQYWFVSYNEYGNTWYQWNPNSYWWDRPRVSPPPQFVEFVENRRVLCNHQGSCARRDENREIPYVSSTYCENCSGYFCSEHHHTNPTARLDHWCFDCSVYHPTCWIMEQCQDCYEWSCDIYGHSCRDEYGDERDGEYYEGPFRAPKLLFEGKAKSSVLAQGKRFVGFEIEVENGTNFVLPNKYGITEDGSLANGVEILTPPARGITLVRNTKEVMDTMREAGWEATERCGLHTHIDLRDVKENARFMARLFMLGFAVEDVLYSLQYEDRHHSSYSVPLRTQFGFNSVIGPTAEDLEYVYNGLDKRDRYSKRRLEENRTTKWGNRYYSWNFHSVWYRGTIENRVHEGTLDAERILNWADLLQAIVERASRRLSIKSLVSIMNAKDKDQMIHQMNRTFDLTPHVIKYMKSTMRDNPVHVPWDYNRPVRAGGW